MGCRVEQDASDRLDLHRADADPKHVRRRVILQAAQRKGQIRSDMTAGVQSDPIAAQNAEPLRHGERRPVIRPFAERFRRQRCDIGRLVG